MSCTSCPLDTSSCAWPRHRTACPLVRTLLLRSLSRHGITENYCQAVRSRLLPLAVPKLSDRWQTGYPIFATLQQVQDVCGIDELISQIVLQPKAGHDSQPFSIDFWPPVKSWASH